MDKIGKRVTRLLLTSLVGYLLALGLLRIFESRFIFFPDNPGRLVGDWSPRGLPIQDVWLASSDGIKLHAWWIPNESATFTILAFHGNAGNIADRAPTYAFLRSAPANVLAVEYHGYGRSEGSPSETGLYRDAEAGLRYLTETKQIAPSSIVSYGQSLGTAVATHLAAEHHLAGVILEAPFPSAGRVARQVLWFLPGLSVLLGSQFDTETKVAKLDAPLLVVHCIRDPVIPFELGQEVYRAGRDPKSFVAINGSCHEEASVIAPDRYMTALQEFLASTIPGSAKGAPRTH